MFLALEAPPPPTAALIKFCGPPTRPLKGVVPTSGGFSLARGTKAALREIPGAVVVVEDETPVFLTRLPPSLRITPWNFRIFGGQEQVGFPGTPPMPVWLDPNITMSGGNVVNRVYSFGGGNF